MLGHQSGGFSRLMHEGRLLDGGGLEPHRPLRDRVDGGEEFHGRHRRGADGRGLCGAAGAVIAMGEAMGSARRRWRGPFSPAGLIGVVIATAWTFAAEVGGCQAEGGSAAAMAAAALVAHGGRHP